jgi:xanthine dehydrogenase YagT iron-sulfur-binding subunit
MQDKNIIPTSPPDADTPNSPDSFCPGEESEAGPTRRQFLSGAAAAGFGLSVAPLFAGVPSAAGQADPPAAAAHTTPLPGQTDVTLHVNGTEHTISIEPRVTLLDALRERLHLTGTKKGCDHGQCGACTVLVDGQRYLSCLSLAIMHQGQKITTIEGLAEGEKLHPMQSAFIQHDGFQCGYCTPGQIMSAVGLVSEGHAKTDEDIREQMSGNICRCGAYVNIVAAIREVMEGRNAPV